MDLAFLDIDLGRRAPDHHQPRAVIVGLELGDVNDQLLGQVHLVLARLNIFAGDAFDVILFENGGHRL